MGPREGRPDAYTGEYDAIDLAMKGLAPRAKKQYPSDKPPYEVTVKTPTATTTFHDSLEQCDADARRYVDHIDAVFGILDRLAQ